MKCMHDLPGDPPDADTGMALRWQPQGVEHVNVYVLQPTEVAKGKHHNDHRAPKEVLPDKVTHMMHPASDMEGEQT